MYSIGNAVNDNAVDSNDNYLALSNEYWKGISAYQKKLVSNNQQTNLFESKLEVLAIRHLLSENKQTVKRDANDKEYNVNYVELNASEIKMLIDSTPSEDKKNKNVYDRIRNAAISLKSKCLIYRNDEEKKFYITNIYSDVSYNNGTLRLEYDPSNKRFFFNFNIYTKMSLPLLFSFRHNSGFQLYTVLKTYAYQLDKIDMKKPQDEQSIYEITFAVPELRVMLGYADVTKTDAYGYIDGKRNIDFNKFEQITENVKYQRWSEFNRRIIVPGIEELNKISDIYVADSIPTGEGIGGKIKYVTFRIQHNVNYYKTMKNAETFTEEKTPQKEIEKIMNMIQSMHTFSEVDAEVLLNDAKGNIEIIERAYEMSKKVERIPNFTGWMRTMIRKILNGEVTENIETIYGSQEQAQRINEIKQNPVPDNMKERIWEKYKEKDDFNDFIQRTGLKQEYLDCLEVEERLDLYLEYKKSVM